MNCPKCGALNNDGVRFCANCGAALPAAQAAPVQQPAYQQPAAQQQGNYGRILSPWAFLGYSILFAIPVVGFILMIVFSVSNTDICRRNFARSYLIIFIICVVITIICIAMGVGAEILESYS